MGKNEPYLKGKNIWWLRLFLAANLVVFLCVVISGQLTAATLDHFWQRISAKDGLIALCLPLLAIVLNGLLSDLGKARLVFWRWRDPLPGCRAFSVILALDPRVDEPRLRAKLGTLPTEPREQNALWFRLYKARSSEQVILESHRVYLLTRDMAALAAVSAICLSSGAWLTGTGWRLATIYSLALFAQYVVIATSARNYGIRFVANVMVEESHS
jgi:hypothetical protein